MSYTASPWGAEYHALQVWEALGAGSAGPGKTTVLRREADAQIAVEHNRCADKSHEYHQPWGSSVGWCLFLRREFSMLEQTIARAKAEYKELFPHGGVEWSEQKKTFTFKSGYKVQFGHCANPDDWQQYYGTEFTLILFDELTQFEEEQYEQITTRLRTVDPVLRHMLKVRSMSNPFYRREGQSGVKDPYWVRRRFVDPAPEGRERLWYTITIPDTGEVVERDRIYLPAKLTDNPNPDFVRQYYVTLASKPPHIRKALIDGNWYFVDGAYFGEDFTRDLHVIEPFDIPPGWRRFRAMDWGYKTWGTVLWFAIDSEDNLICYREYNFRERSPRYVAARVREIEELDGLKWHGDSSPITGVADTQLWEKRGHVGRSKAEEFMANGVHWRPADKRSRAMNGLRVLARLKDWTTENPHPALVFFSVCKMCIRTIPSLMPDQNEPEAPAKSADDHWGDAVMYAAALASNPDTVSAPTRGDSGFSRYKPPSARGKRNYGYGY